MAICPVANSVGCEKCGVVNFCFLKTVLGNYCEEKPKASSENTTSEDTTVDVEAKPPDS